MFPNLRSAPPPAPIITGIIFHETHRWRFSEPALIGGLFSPNKLLGGPGVYAILTVDPDVKPRPFRVLYFGESEDIGSRATSTHESYSSWQREAGPNGKLYRALYWMLESTQKQRQVVESTLIEAYTPPCNQRLSFDFSKLVGYK